MKLSRFIYKISFFYFILLLFCSFFFLSCSPKKEVIEAKHPNGSPQIIAIYKDKTKTGELKYYDNGTKEMEGNYNEKSEREGKWTYWFKDGKLWSECEYKNGLKDGKSTVYYENGQKRYEGNYRNDSTIGQWKFWNEKGELVKDIKY